MFSLEVEFLTGNAVASDREDRSVAEWPPHPQRLFAALVAAYEERSQFPDERSALAWLESLAAPEIEASDASMREQAAVFVPVNHTEVPEQMPAETASAKKWSSWVGSGIGVLPDRRPRQERRFPTVIPNSPIVHFVWPIADEHQVTLHRAALTRLAENVTYLGHSSSLVRVAVCDTPPTATWRPAREDETAERVLRIASPGRLQDLEQAFQLSVERVRRIEPPQGLSQGYVRVSNKCDSVPINSVFGDAIDWFVCRKRTRAYFPLEDSLLLTTAVRDALICHSNQAALSEIVTGHQSNRLPSETPHMAIVPLAHVGHPHADGDVKGFAVVLPRGASRADRRAVLMALDGLLRQPVPQLKMGHAGSWSIDAAPPDNALRSLEPKELYFGPARCWATVTPFIFGRFPRRLISAEAEEIVAESCQMIGLPRPRAVQVTEVSSLLRVAPSHNFPTLSTKGKLIACRFSKGRYRLDSHDEQGHPPRLRAHVIIEFDQPIAGPVIVGAGRYFGMGLCRPIDADLKRRRHA